MSRHCAKLVTAWLVISVYLNHVWGNGTVVLDIWILLLFVCLIWVTE